MKKIKPKLCLWILILSACAASSQSVTKVPATITVETLANPTTIEPSTLTQAVSSSLAPAMTPTQSASKIVRQCLDVTNDTHQLSGIENGLIVVAQDKSSSEIYEKLKSPYLYDMATSKKIEIPGLDF
jgi:hypothetical protein